MRLSAIISACLFGVICSTAKAQPVTFVALGDLPYNPQEVDMLTHPNGSLAKAISAIKPPFVVHYGDIKPGDMDCSDKVLGDMQKLLSDLYPQRLIYTPGDNEWTDCDRSYVPNPADELERLDKIRELFFKGKGLQMTQGVSGIERQVDYPENAMWQWQQVQLGTVHVVGTNNGRAGITRSDVDTALDLVDKRDSANMQWLAKLFRQAEQSGAKALVIAMQADLYKPPAQGSERRCSPKQRTECNGLLELQEFIEFASANVKFPVLLVHGDTSSFCLHQPKPDLAANYWRLNGPGDYKVIDAVTISIDAANGHAPFEVKMVLSGEAPPTQCIYKKK